MRLIYEYYNYNIYHKIKSNKRIQNKIYVISVLCDRILRQNTNIWHKQYSKNNSLTIALIF